jgi:hypothetical protein
MFSIEARSRRSEVRGQRSEVGNDEKTSGLVLAFVFSDL